METLCPVASLRASRTPERRDGGPRGGVRAAHPRPPAGTGQHPPLQGVGGLTTPGVTLAGSGTAPPARIHVVPLPDKQVVIPNLALPRRFAPCIAHPGASRRRTPRRCSSSSPPTTSGNWTTSSASRSGGIDHPGCHSRWIRNSATRSHPCRPAPGQASSHPQGRLVPYLEGVFRRAGRDACQRQSVVVEDRPLSHIRDDQQSEAMPAGVPNTFLIASRCVSVAKSGSCATRRIRLSRPKVSRNRISKRLDSPTAIECRPKAQCPAGV